MKELAPQSAVTDHLAILSDAIRVRMLAVLEGRELTVTELCDVLQLPQSTVSRHLKTLSDGEWVVSRRDGTRRLYVLSVSEMESFPKELWEVVRDQVKHSSAASDDDRRLKHILAKRRTKSEEFFSSAAGQWNRLREELFGATSHLRAMVGFLDPEAVVGDLGCGTGNVSEWLAPFASRIIAVDDSKEMLKTAKQTLNGHRNVEVRHGSLEKLPIDNAELNVAVLMLVLHHLAEPQLALSEAARVLKRGGRVLILDMLSHDREDYRQTMGHVWLGFSEKQTGRWLSDAGFKDMRWRLLPPEAGARGPSLFVATARRA